MQAISMLLSLCAICCICTQKEYFEKIQSINLRIKFAIRVEWASHWCVTNVTFAIITIKIWIIWICEIICGRRPLIVFRASDGLVMVKRLQVSRDGHRQCSFCCCWGRQIFVDVATDVWCSAGRWGGGGAGNLALPCSRGQCPYTARGLCQRQ